MFCHLMLRQNENNTQSRPMNEDDIKQELKNQWNGTSTARQMKYPTKVKEAFDAFVGKDGKDPTTSRLYQLAPEALQQVMMSIFTWDGDRDRIQIVGQNALRLLGAFDMLPDFYETMTKYQLKYDPTRRGTYQNGQMRKIPRYAGNSKTLSVQGSTKMEDPEFTEANKKIWTFLGCLRVQVDWYMAYYFIECFKLKDRLTARTEEAKWIAELKQGYLTTLNEVSHLDSLTIQYVWVQV